MWKLTYLFALLAYAYSQSAVVYLFDPTSASGVTGNITFTKIDDGILINGEVKGLAKGEHGFHVHELGNIAVGCTGTGLHFNPHNLTHGAPEDEIRHVGDLGNIVAASDGVATVNFTDSIIALEGEHSIIGRAVVVHELRDDLGKGGNADSLTTGNAGGRVACGVIGILTTASSASPMSSSIIMILATFVFSLRFYFK